MEPSAPNRMSIIVLSLLIGGLAGTGLAVVLQSTKNQDGEIQDKYDEVKRSFSIRGLWRGVQGWGKEMKRKGK
jgi:hypothetical protein